MIWLLLSYDNDHREGLATDQCQLCPYSATRVFLLPTDHYKIGNSCLISCQWRNCRQLSLVIVTHITYGGKKWMCMSMYVLVCLSLWKCLSVCVCVCVRACMRERERETERDRERQRETDTERETGERGLKEAIYQCICNQSQDVEQQKMNTYLTRSLWERQGGRTCTGWLRGEPYSLALVKQYDGGQEHGPDPM